MRDAGGCAGCRGLCGMQGVVRDAGGCAGCRGLCGPYSVLDTLPVLNL